MRTRYRSLQTNRVVEPFFQPIKYEQLYREEIQNGARLAHDVAVYCQVYDNVRPHEALALLTPMEVYLKPPEV